MKKVKEDYDDFVGCTIQSLKDKFIDHCFSKRELDKIIKRWSDEGKGSFMYKKYLDRYGEFDYYKLIPIQCFRKAKNGDGDVCLKKIILDYSQIPEELKIVSGTFGHYYVIKDYNQKPNKVALNYAIYYIEKRDYD